jgi:hypothetical protein
MNKFKEIQINKDRIKFFLLVIGLNVMDLLIKIKSKSTTQDNGDRNTS